MSQCVAHISKGPRQGERCSRPAKNGTTVCSSHGARAPQVKAAAERRVAEAEARAKAVKAAARAGVIVEPSANPLDVLDSLLTEAITVKSYLGGLARRLEDDQLRYPGRTGEQVRAEWQLYTSMMRDIARLAESMIKLDISERRQRLQEGQAVLLVQVIRSVLDDLNLTAEQRSIAAKSVSERLREVSGGLDSEDHRPV